ncbi:histidine utilization repressor [Hephaestia sp. GCM10023244]|uniref:histidine utilization repressor n=1 Tax=unclassified Hephaestia TaxID=2631281 RepID=UPI002076F769|nr:histidine utilization repressor [Hephaestia sp. MAHUQ-44]MCM8731229.1 histidine utilization repressor [Hephaestia sp. MAHUQ-44]
MSLDARIRADIEARIRSGAWPPGHRIPFEHELTETYGCSRATVSKALGALARAGFIERRRRAGSFVAHPPIHAAVLDVPDLRAVIEARGEAYRWALTEQRRHAGAEVPEIGRVGPILAVTGLHQADSAPFGFERRWIAIHAAPETAAQDFTAIAPGSWLLAHVPWSDARHRISAVGADPDAAAALDLTAGEACLSLERWTWRRGALVTYVRQVFPGTRYDLVAEFKPSS